ncbi:MAG TPA: hypothetical protein PLU38_01165 [Kiritimatiellia bacterium]|jgi:hypothetical protein|nr:MAG: hypothetical protein BWX70_00405 [Verrucomicrobia bacterium ADurb.Bin070]HPB09802.1 hypothetical protein [Kiritimatiellia bacterium]HPO37301.1 hypothetical protein [Kiritimatiellia bacterium]HQQ90448.1 hypothetical protein [Kiritimatiellia bacterium]
MKRLSLTSDLLKVCALLRLCRTAAGAALLVAVCASDARGGEVGNFDGFFLNMSPSGNFLLPTLQGTVSARIVSEAGRLTAKVTLQSGRLVFTSSAWDSDNGQASSVVLNARSGETLWLSVTNGVSMEGTLSNGSLGDTVLRLFGGRNLFWDRRDAAAQETLRLFKGYYTMSLPNNAVLWQGAAQAAPTGIGHLSMKIGTRGKAKIGGRLADGTRVSQTAQLIFLEGIPFGYVPFFVPLYGRNGWAGGIMTIDPSNGVMAAPYRVCWDNPGSGPDGFQLTMNLCGGYYRALSCACGWNDAPGVTFAQAYLFSADPPLGMSYYDSLGPVSFVPGAVPQEIGVSTRLPATFVMARGVKPVKQEDGTYFYPAGNSAQARLSFSARTGIFKGRFKLYADGVSTAGKPTHKAVSVVYQGVLTPVRDPAYALWPTGMGCYTVPDKDPAVAPYRVKRSFPVWLEDAQ